MTCQKLVIIGNLEWPPQLRYRADGIPVTELRVVTYMNNQTTRFYVNAINIWAEVANSLILGQQVLIEGRLSPDPSTGCPKVQESTEGLLEAKYIVTAEHIVPFEIANSVTTMTYEGVKSLYWEARQHHDIAISKLHEPDTPVPHSYKKPFWVNNNQTFPAGDKEWLERLQKVANKLYEQIASLNPVVEFLAARGQELYVLGPKFMGLQAKRVQEMAIEVQGWSTEIRTQLDEKLRLADEWQLNPHFAHSQLNREQDRARLTV